MTVQGDIDVTPQTVRRSVAVIATELAIAGELSRTADTSERDRLLELAPSERVLESPLGLDVQVTSNFGASPDRWARSSNRERRPLVQIDFGRDLNRYR